MVRRVPSSRRSSSGSLSSQPVAVHRRIGFRLGCLPRRRPHVWLVVSPLFQLFDKPPGAPCGPLWGSRVPLPSPASVRQPVRGQHHRFGLLQEPGRHSFIAPQLGGAGDLAPLRGAQGSFGAPVHSRVPERAGRHPESSVAGLRIGMGPLFSNLPGTSSSVAGGYRPLRHFVEPSPSRLLLADGQSTVGGHGCYDAAMGWSSGLCLPSFWPSPARHRGGPAVSRLELTLVAPFWPQHPWFPDLLELLVAVPVFLPRRKDLLRQPHFHCFHQNLAVLRLTVFRILSAPPAPLASLQQWLGSLPKSGTPPPE